jgi:hypothetical protein
VELMPAGVPGDAAHWRRGGLSTMASRTAKPSTRPRRDRLLQQDGVELRRLIARPRWSRIPSSTETPLTGDDHPVDRQPLWLDAAASRDGEGSRACPD